MSAEESIQTPRASIDIWLRSAVFFVTYNMFGLIHSLLCLIVAPFLNYRQRYAFCSLWTRASMWLLHYLNGIRVEVHGMENLPDNEPMVVMANHQSQWETFYLQLLIAPQATVLKRELLRVPFFGWGLALTRPIAINRQQPSSALKTILRQGKQRLEEGIPVMIYPEGTRQPPGTLGKFNSGGAMLACQAGVRVLPIAHNAGGCWPARTWLKYPGTIRLVIGPPIKTSEKKPKRVNAEVEQWMRQTLSVDPLKTPEVKDPA